MRKSNLLLGLRDNPYCLISEGGPGSGKHHNKPGRRRTKMSGEVKTLTVTSPKGDKVTYPKEAEEMMRDYMKLRWFEFGYPKLDRNQEKKAEAEFREKYSYNLGGSSVGYYTMELKNKQTGQEYYLFHYSDSGDWVLVRKEDSAPFFGTEFMTISQKPRMPRKR